MRNFVLQGLTENDVVSIKVVRASNDPTTEWHPFLYRYSMQGTLPDDTITVGVSMDYDRLVVVYKDDD